MQDRRAVNLSPAGPLVLGQVYQPQGGMVIRLVSCMAGITCAPLSGCVSISAGVHSARRMSQVKPSDIRFRFLHSSQRGNLG